MASKFLNVSYGYVSKFIQPFCLEIVTSRFKSTFVNRPKRVFKPAVVFAIGLALFAVFLITNYLLLITPAHALDVGVNKVQETIALSGTDIRVIIARIISVALGLLGIVAVVIVLYGGFLWMTAQGDEDKVAQAKRVLVNGAIGLAIILSAFAITRFVLNKLVEATTGVHRSEFVGGGAIENSGSLGRGIIDMHFPQTGAVDIGRNVNMIITFKRPIQLSSIITGYDDNGTPDNLSDDTPSTNLNVASVQIYRDADGPESALTSDAVVVRFTPDRKTFVFDPVEWIGSSTSPVRYRVDLPGDGLRLEGGAAAFTGAFSGGYRNWWFDTGTEVDLTPPQVVDFFPFPASRPVPPFRSAAYERNVLIQVNYNEAIDPTSVVLPGNVEVEGDSTPVTGRWDPANNYETYEFTTTAACGENSCGETIYCLPASADIGVTVHAADLTSATDDGAAATFPYTGITDAYANSLNDRGNNAEAEGSPTDDVFFTFATSAEIDISPPAILSIAPPALTGDVAPDVPVTVEFSEVMSRASLNTDSIRVLPAPDHELWYSVGSSLVYPAGAPAGSGPTGTRAEVRHALFLQRASDAPPSQGYVPVVTPLARDAYQNCFVPSAGPGDTPAGTCTPAPYCCNGVPTDVASCGAPGGSGVNIGS